MHNPEEIGVGAAISIGQSPHRKRFEVEDD
jgi:hypothetical protein